MTLRVGFSFLFANNKFSGFRTLCITHSMVTMLAAYLILEDLIDAQVSSSCRKLINKRGVKGGCSRKLQKALPLVLA